VSAGKHPRLTNTPNDSLVLGFSNLRQARLERPLVITGGRGVFIFDENGKQYLEASSSFYCAALGYSDARLIEAATRQLTQMPFYTSAQHRTLPVVMELAEKLCALAPVSNAHVAFATTGSEAVDFLMKFMRYRNVHRGEAERRKVISRWGGYHGGTMMTAALGGAKTLHASFALPMEDHLFVSQPDYFNNHLEGETEPQFLDRLIDELEQTIIDAGPEAVAAFIAEPISFSCGFAVPPENYFPRVREVLDRYGIALFGDEVVTGFCRTGNMFGAESVKAKPDCVTIAKAMSAAYIPISGILMSADFYGDLEAHSDTHGVFAHAGTYSAHPVGAAVALEMLRIIDEEDLLGQVRARSATFRDRMDRLRAHPLVADVRTLGLGGAVQLISDGPSEGVGAVVGGLAKALGEAALDRGLIVRVTGPSAVIAPPLIITDAEIDELFDRFELALQDAEQSVTARR